VGSWYTASVAPRRRRRFRQGLDPAVRSAIARAAGKYGGRIGGPARAQRLTPLERSRIAMQGGRARAASMTAEERREWSDYMRKHQRRFWDGKLPRKPIRERTPVSVGALPVSVPTGVATRPLRAPVPAPIPVIVTPQRVRVEPLPAPWKLRPAKRFDV
jgi:hypothetical protein